MSKPLVTPANVHRLADAAVRGRAGWSGGMVMSLAAGETPPPGTDAPPPPPPSGDAGNGNGDTGGDDTVTIDGREWKIRDLQRLAADEKRQGKRAGERAVLEQLGVDDVDKAKALIAAAQEAQRKDESEAQRIQREAAAEKDRAAAERAAAVAERRTTSIERQLLRGGVNEADLDDAVVLLERGLDADADADAITDAVAKLKERREELFTAAPPAPRRGAGPLPAGRPAARNQPGDKPFGAGGLARAERRFGKQQRGA